MSVHMIYFIRIHSIRVQCTCVFVCILLSTITTPRGYQMCSAVVSEVTGGWLEFLFGLLDNGRGLDVSHFREFLQVFVAFGTDHVGTRLLTILVVNALDHIHTLDHF